MYCRRCGQKLDDDFRVCPYCGEPVDNVNVQYDYSDIKPNNDKGGFGLALIGFLFPIVGLILYIVWKKDKPKSAKSAGKGALISVILNIVVNIILFMIGISIPNPPSGPTTSGEIFYTIINLL